MAFADELKQCRGKELQKRFCDVFGVNLFTYQKWEQGVNVPADLIVEQCRWRMAALTNGVSVEFYRARYLSVIKKVAAEIEAIK